jgi:hypothetical protein
VEKLCSPAGFTSTGETVGEIYLFGMIYQATVASGGARVISDCHFRKTATEYDRKPGIKWLSCTAK